MKLDDLSKWDGYTYDLRQKAAFGAINSTHEKDPAVVLEFKGKWIKGQATLSEWLKIGPIDLNQLVNEEGLTTGEAEQLLGRQKHLYSLWLQARLQYGLLYYLDKVLELTPDQILPFVQLQVDAINRLLLSNERPKQGYGPPSLRVRSEIDYAQLYIKVQSPGFQHSYDIHGADGMVYLEEILLYKTFLEAFQEDSIIAEERTYEVDEMSIDAVFPKTKKALDHVVFDVRYRDTFYKENEYRTWSINSANHHFTPYAFRFYLKTLFRDEYRQLLYRLMEFDFNTKESILLGLAEELTGFRDDLILSDTYKQEESEYGEKETYTFKRLKRVGFNGTESFSYAFNDGEDSTYKYLLKMAEPYAMAAEDAINAFIRKLEDTANYLDLLDFSMEVAAQSSDDTLSFEYLKKDRELINITTFYNFLKDGGFIEPSTPLSSFRNVFMGKKVFNPIIWTGTTGELHYTIKTLHTTQKKLKQTPRKLWEKVCHCFKRPGGIPFDPELLRKAKRPADTSRLDRICENL